MSSHELSVKRLIFKLDSLGIIAPYSEILEHDLTTRELFVLKRRLGMEGSPSMSYKAISEEYGATRERMRQLEFRGMRKLRKRVLCS